MTTWELYTWIAIVVLVVGSVGIFVWFLVDVRRLLRRRGHGGEVGPEEDRDRPNARPSPRDP
jgi:hypothetical protein